MNENSMGTALEATLEVAKTTGKAIDAAREAGGFFSEFIRPPLQVAIGMWTDQLNYRRWSNAIDLEQRAQAKLTSLGSNVSLRQVPLSVGVPLVEAAALEESDDLRELWANMLANFADQNSEVIANKSFVTVMKDLSPLDVAILNKIYSMEGVEKRCVLTEHLPDSAAFELPTKAGEARREPGMPRAEVELSIANLFRLQCLQTAKIGGPDVFDGVYTTTFGHEFFKACTLRSISPI